MMTWCHTNDMKMSWQIVIPINTLLSALPQTTSLPIFRAFNETTKKKYEKMCILYRYTYAYDFIIYI